MIWCKELEVMGGFSGPLFPGWEPRIIWRLGEMIGNRIPLTYMILSLFIYCFVFVSK